MQPRVATLRPGARKDPSASQVILLSQRKRNRISQETNLRGLWHGAQEGEHGQRYFDPGSFRDSGDRGPRYPDLQTEEEGTQVIPIRLSPFEPTSLRKCVGVLVSKAARVSTNRRVSGQGPDVKVSTLDKPYRVKRETKGKGP